MKNIKDLIFISDKQTVSRPKLQASSATRKNKQALLYEIIYYNEFGNEDEIARQLYGKSADSSHNNYVKLKSRLKKKLMQSLFFLEPNNKTLKLSINASKQIYLGKILHGLRATEMAIKSLQKGMLLAAQGEHFDLARDAANLLLKIGFESNNMVIYHAALKSLEEYESLGLLQSKTLRKYYEIQLLIKSSASSDKIAYSIDDLIHTITSKVEKELYFTFSLKYFQLLHLKYHLNNNFKSIIHNSKAAIESLSKFEDIPEKDIFYFKAQYLNACKALQKYEEGNTFISQNSSNQNIRSLDLSNLILHQYYCLFAFGQKNYERVLQEADFFGKSKIFKSLGNQEKAICKLYKTYAEIACYVSGNEMSYKERYCDDIVNVKTDKLLAELEILKQNKRGTNVALLVLEIMLYMVQDNRDMIHDRIDAIKTYRSRYLRLPEHNRANAFLSLIINLEKNAFDLSKVEEQNTVIYNSLLKNPDNLASKMYEVIPFDHAYSLIVNLLENQKRFSKVG